MLADARPLGNAGHRCPAASVQQEVEGDEFLADEFQVNRPLRRDNFGGDFRQHIGGAVERGFLDVLLAPAVRPADWNLPPVLNRNSDGVDEGEVDSWLHASAESSNPRQRGCCNLVREARRQRGAGGRLHRAVACQSI